MPSFSKPFTFVILLMACVPLPYVKGLHSSYLNRVATDDETAISYCRRLADHGDRASSINLVVGIALSVIAAGLTITGAALGPDFSAGASELSKHRGTLLTAGGTLLGVPAAVLLARVADQARVGAEATRGMGNGGDMSACLDARALYLESRSTSAALAQERLAQARHIIERISPTDGGVAAPVDPALIQQLRRAVE